MHSPQKRSGWTATGPKTVERRRKGRNADTVGSLPTPPQTRHKSHLPTPETVRQTSKRIASPSAGPSTSLLPTPQTVPRPARQAPPSPAEHVEPPSPSGHTTFFLSSSTASSSRPEGTYRRRPGLTFAQQMGLISHSGEQVGSSGSGARLGAGVGMGGARTGGHKVDKIRGRLDAPLGLEENPFLVEEDHPMASPGIVTSHRPTLVEATGSEDEDHPMSSPLQSRRKGKSALRSPAMLHPSSLLTPPQTQKSRRTLPPSSPGTLTRQAAARERQARLQRMRDEDSNPFLVKPGNQTIHRPGPIVDECRPTVTYVFRGAKKVFANPFIDPDTHIPDAELNPSDDEYEPHPCPRPKLLWPTGPSTPRVHSEEEVSPPSSPMATPTARGRFSAMDTEEETLKGPSDVFTSDEEFVLEEEHKDDQADIPVRRGLLFGPGSMKRGSGEHGRRVEGGKRIKGLRV